MTLKLASYAAKCPVTKVDTDLPVLPERCLNEEFIRQSFACSDVPWSQIPIYKGIPAYNGKPVREAAVLMPILSDHTKKDSELEVLLMRRSAHLKDHAGQVSFPGGKVDANDLNEVATALRETHEEVGIRPESIEVLGAMPAHETGTAFRIVPVVGIIQGSPFLQLNREEVESAFTVPLSYLMNPSHHRWHEYLMSTDDGKERLLKWLSIEYQYQGESYFIWGATAAMLRNLYSYLMAIKDYIKS